jgi:hypothetical protein
MSSDQEDDIEEVPVKGRNADLIRKAIKIFEDKMTKGEMKVSAGEYIRLLELLQQVDGDEPREITVRWVDKRNDSKDLDKT